MKEKCPECGSVYVQIGNHWQHRPSHRPSIGKELYDIIVGLLMGDGTLCYHNKNSFIQCQMTSPKYLKHLDDIFGVLGAGVVLHLTGEEIAKSHRNNGFEPNADGNNYSDSYRWRSRSHPEFNQFNEWYETGKKLWPENIELTPTVLKHWYCGDGHWSNYEKTNSIKISASNENGNIEKINSMFRDVGLPEPSNYMSRRRDDGRIDFSIQFTTEQSHQLWDYMGDPLPNFEYKWPEEYR